MNEDLLWARLQAEMEEAVADFAGVAGIALLMNWYVCWRSSIKASQKKAAAKTLAILRKPKHSTL